MAHWLRAHPVLLGNAVFIPAPLPGASQSPVFPGDPMTPTLVCT